jgi:hypothetical protein
MPFRSLFEGFGLKVDWDSPSRTVTGSAQNMQIALTIGSLTAYVNGEQRTLSQAPRIENGSTYIPIRFVGETLDKSVSWDGKKLICEYRQPITQTASFRGLFKGHRNAERWRLRSNNGEVRVNVYNRNESSACANGPQ